MKKIEFKKYDDVIKYYKSISITNEYTINPIDEVILPTHASLFDIQKKAINRVEKHNNGGVKFIVSDNIVKRFHPSNINNQRFWKLAKKEFSLFSVCGSEVNTVVECNEKNTEIAKYSGFIDFIDDLILSKKEKINFFEIGFGHGNIFALYNQKLN
jgi:hypothetical protein